MPGDSFDPHNISGTVRAFFEALSRRGLLVRRLDVSISRWQRYRLAATTFHPVRDRWQGRFRRAVYEAQSRNCAKLLDGDHEPNVILQPFRGFQLVACRIGSSSTRRMRSGGRRGGKVPSAQTAWATETERDLYRGAEHIFVMASEPKVSLVGDYGVDEGAVSVVGGV